jgi:lipid II:glycine glycyltransferase (peptidoglycan interpeptide bridge formation enzyme)
VFRTNDPVYFHTYYRLYEASAKRWGSSTTYSKELLSDLHKVPGIHMWVAEYEGTMLSGMICFYHENSVFDWLAASIINDDVKKWYPAVAVQYEVIRHASENGYSFVNMGASKDLNGVRDFKDSWGANAQKTYTFTRRRGLFAAIKRFQRK